MKAVSGMQKLEKKNKKTTSYREWLNTLQVVSLTHLGWLETVHTPVESKENEFQEAY